MVKQYPYKLEVLSTIGGARDANGDYVPAAQPWTELCSCRDEAGNGKPITTADGQQHQYSFLIQMPKGTEAIKAGTKVRVLDGLEVRAEGTVIYSRKDQFHSRAWV